MVSSASEGKIKKSYTAKGGNSLSLSGGRKGAKVLRATPQAGEELCKRKLLPLETWALRTVRDDLAGAHCTSGGEAVPFSRASHLPSFSCPPLSLKENLRLCYKR